MSSIHQKKKKKLVLPRNKTIELSQKKKRKKRKKTIEYSELNVKYACHHKC